MNSRKKQADYYMAGALGLTVVATGITLWLFARYQQAASMVETALAKGIQLEKGRATFPAAQAQVVADARLRAFLVAGVLTGLCALGLAVIVLWHRKQRLQAAAEPVGAEEAARA